MKSAAHNFYHQLRITYFNRAAERQYGVSTEEALGHLIEEGYD